MIVTITYIELRGPFKFFALSAKAMKIVKQMKGTNYKDFKNTGWWTKHYTMSLWDSKEEMQEFARSGAHLEAMKSSAEIACEIRSCTYQSDHLPDWKFAKEKVMEGKVITF